MSSYSQSQLVYCRLFTIIGAIFFAMHSVLNVSVVYLKYLLLIVRWLSTSRPSRCTVWEHERAARLLFTPARLVAGTRARYAFPGYGGQRVVLTRSSWQMPPLEDVTRSATTPRQAVHFDQFTTSSAPSRYQFSQITLRGVLLYTPTRFLPITAIANSVARAHFFYDLRTLLHTHVNVEAHMTRWFSLKNNCPTMPPSFTSTSTNKSAKSTWGA